MSSETVWPLVSQYTAEVWEAALEYVRQNFVMGGLVRSFSMPGFNTRNVTEYLEGTVDTDLGELEDLTPQLLERKLLATLTPQEHGTQYIITDRRIESDLEDVLADAATAIGYEIGKQLELHLLSDFSKLTGGSVGTAGQPLSWANIYAARTTLAAAGIPGPYTVVLHEFQYHDLATAANIAGSSLQPVLKFRDDIQSQYYVGSVNNMNFFTSGLVPIDGSDDALGAMFNSQALALDMRRGLRIEPQRDASLRSTELNATIAYAHGVWRPSWGVKIISDATALASAVTVNSDVGITGYVDDTSASAGQDLIVTFVLTNFGTQIATDIEVTLTHDTNFTYLSSTPSQGVYNSTTKVWTAGSLAPGRSAVMRMVWDATTAGASKVITGTVSAVTPTDNVSGNDASTVTVTIT